MDLTFPPAFAPFAPNGVDAKALSTLPLQKIVYFLCNLLTLALGLWKCRSMGLLPTGTGDWLAFETRGSVSPHRNDSITIVDTSLFYVASRDISTVNFYYLCSLYHLFQFKLLQLTVQPVINPCPFNHVRQRKFHAIETD